MIRMARPEDVPAMLAIYGPYARESTASFEYEAPPLEEFSRRFAAVTAQYPWLVFEEKGAVLGYAYASAPYSRAAYSWCAEPTIYLRPDARGRGIGKELYDALEEILFRQGYRVLYALVSAENGASRRFHEKRGYVLRAEFPGCGFKFGRWVGLLWYEKRPEIVQNPSSFPRPWMEIVQNEEMLRDILDNLSIF